MKKAEGWAKEGRAGGHSGVCVLFRSPWHGRANIANRRARMWREQRSSTLIKRQGLLLSIELGCASQMMSLIGRVVAAEFTILEVQAEPQL